MPSVEELLSVAEIDANTRSAMDSRIEIDADTRIIRMMPQDELFGVESDEKSERKYFKVHKIVGNGVDLSKLQLRINYQNASKIPSGKDMYIVTDATVYNDEWVYFLWELSRKVTQYKGNIYFIVCAVKADSNGNITNEWNTTLAEGKVLEGLEVETNQEQQYQASDYLEQLKQQLLDYSKEIKDTFPSDYTQIQDDIGSLKEDIDNLKSVMKDIRNNTPHVSTIESFYNIRRTGKVYQTKIWKFATNPEYDLVTISDTPNEKYKLKPWTECKRAGGTITPWYIGSAYASGIASDGILRSQPRLKPERDQSHNNMITNYQKKGKGHLGAGSERNTFQILFNIIKGATKNSQSIFRGCTEYNFQYSASIESADAHTYFPVTNAQAQNILIGSYVSVGYGELKTDTNTVNNDRGVNTIHAYADDVKVLRIETLDENNKAVYLDIKTGFNTTPIKLSDTVNAPITITSMHW